jgi:hypothetical protein
MLFVRHHRPGWRIAFQVKVPSGTAPVRMGIHAVPGI